MIPTATLDARIKRDQQRTSETQREYVQKAKPLEVQAAEQQPCPAARGFKHWIPVGTTECVRGCGLSFSPELLRPHRHQNRHQPQTTTTTTNYYNNH